MRHNLINRPLNWTNYDNVSRVNRQAEKFFVWEKHPRQKNKDFNRPVPTPLLFL